MLTSVSHIRCKFKKKQKKGNSTLRSVEGVRLPTSIEGEGRGKGEELIDLSMGERDVLPMPSDGVRNRGLGSLDDPPRRVSYLSIFANTKRRHSYSCIPGVYGRATVSPPANPVNEFSRTAPSGLSNTGRGAQGAGVGAERSVERSASSRNLKRQTIPSTYRSSSAKTAKGAGSFLKKDGSPGQTSFTSIRAKLQLESRNMKIKKSKRRKEKRKRRKVIAV